MELFAQAISIAAMTFNILSYQCKTDRGAIGMQLCGGALFSVSFLMLGATVGGILNVIAVLRAVVFMNRGRLHAEHPAWLGGFVALFLLAYLATFTLFDKPFTAANALLELLPVVGMIATTLSFRLQNARAIRLYGLISSPSWLVYNVACRSVGAIICESLSLISILVGLWRHDRKGRRQR